MNQLAEMCCLRLITGVSNFDSEEYGEEELPGEELGGGGDPRKHKCDLQ